jgi:hypothetical protein
LNRIEAAILKLNEHPAQSVAREVFVSFHKQNFSLMLTRTLEIYFSPESCLKFFGVKSSHYRLIGEAP